MLEDNFAGSITGNNITCFAHETIRGHTIADVHKAALYELVWHRKTNASVTEDGEKVIEVGPRTYVISDILKDRFVDFLPYSKKFLDEYTRCLIDGYDDNVNFEYDYHERLYNYEDCNGPVCCLGINQIDIMIKKLIENTNTRRAVAITWGPRIDNYRKDVPCLQYIQMVIRNDTLHMNVLFRSNDMLSAFGSNAYALTTLQKNITDYISRSINKKLQYGYYNHTVTCPHIYYERDAMEYKKVMNYCIENKLI